MNTGVIGTFFSCNCYYFIKTTSNFFNRYPRFNHGWEAFFPKQTDHQQFVVLDVSKWPFGKNSYTVYLAVLTNTPANGMPG